MHEVKIIRELLFKDDTRYYTRTNLSLDTLFADDHSRVVLATINNDPHSDYISASYIDVSKMFVFSVYNYNVLST